jgi:ATP-binding cassette subfamily B protein
MSNQKKEFNSKRTTVGPGSRGPIGRPPEKAKNFKQTMKKLLVILSEYKVSLIIVLSFAIGSSLFMIIGPKILGRVTTRIFEGVVGIVSGTDSGIDFSYISKTLAILLCLYLASSIFSYIQNFIMSKISVQISYNFRKSLSKKINMMPFRYFDETNHGEILSRFTNDVETINQTLSQGFSQIITSLTTVVGILIMMLTISWQMTLAAILIMPISLKLVTFIIKHSQKYFKEQQNYIGHVNGHIEEMYGGHLVMKAFNGEKKSIEKFDEYNKTLYKSAWKSQFFSSIMMPLMSFIGNVGYVIVSILGGWFAAKGVISVGDIQAFIQYMRSFTQPLAQLANVSNILQQTAAAAERVFEFLEENEEICEISKPVKLNKIDGNVEFKNIHFGYTPEKIIINNFSAKISQGQKVAIVGPTGAGKTTMVKLLMRFYDVNEGEITIDGHNIKEFLRNDLRNNFGMVLQDTWLYNDTIMNNIRYGNLTASDEEVIEAAKAAHVDSFVHNLPNGYDMIINEETSNISQGQKQLITIARAILSEPRILILDEATSSVDTRTEIQIQNAMNTLMKNRTSFIIAHRLSTIRDADLILVMDNGDIVEKGTHNELLAKKEFYYNLYNSQFEKLSI